MTQLELREIEDKAREHANANVYANLDYSRADVLREKKKSYIQGAIDQDLISREDERKMVIEKACKVFCNMCRNHYRLLHGYDCTQLNNGNCAIYKQFKHAMEEIYLC